MFSDLNKHLKTSKRYSLSPEPRFYSVTDDVKLRTEKNYERKITSIPFIFLFSSWIINHSVCLFIYLFIYYLLLEIETLSSPFNNNINIEISLLSTSRQQHRFEIILLFSLSLFVYLFVLLCVFETYVNNNINNLETWERTRARAYMKKDSEREIEREREMVKKVMTMI